MQATSTPAERLLESIERAKKQALAIKTAMARIEILEGKMLSGLAEAKSGSSADLLVELREVRQQFMADVTPMLRSQLDAFDKLEGILGAAS